MGIAAYKCSGIARVVFKDTPARLVAAGREARAAVVHGLGENRVLLAALAVGLARRALRVATRWARERGVLDRQAVAHRLARAAAMLSAALALVEKAAVDFGEDKAPPLWETSAAKYVAVEASVDALRAARLTLGGYAYAERGPARSFVISSFTSRHWSRRRAHRIYSLR